MNAPRHDQEALRQAAAQFQTNAARLEQLRARVEAEIRRGNALLVAVRLDRIMRQMRAQP